MSHLTKNDDSSSSDEEPTPPPSSYIISSQIQSIPTVTLQPFLIRDPSYYVVVNDAVTFRGTPSTLPCSCNICITTTVSSSSSSSVITTTANSIPTTSTTPSTSTTCSIEPPIAKISPMHVRHQELLATTMKEQKLLPTLCYCDYCIHTGDSTPEYNPDLPENIPTYSPGHIIQYYPPTSPETILISDAEDESPRSPILYHLSRTPTPERIILTDNLPIQYPARPIQSSSPILGYDTYENHTSQHSSIRSHTSSSESNSASHNQFSLLPMWGNQSAQYIPPNTTPYPLNVPQHSPPPPTNINLNRRRLTVTLRTEDGNEHQTIIYKCTACNTVFNFQGFQLHLRNCARPFMPLTLSLDAEFAIINLIELSSLGNVRERLTFIIYSEDNTEHQATLFKCSDCNRVSNLEEFYNHLPACQAILLLPVTLTIDAEFAIINLIDRSS